MRTLIGFALMLAAMGSSEAQTPFKLLKGAKSFDLVVAADEPSNTCGIVEARIQDQVMQVAQSVGLTLSPTPTLRAEFHLPTLVVAMISKHGIFTDDLSKKSLLQNICATSIRLTAVAPPNETIDATGHKGGAMAFLWGEQVLEAGDVLVHKFGVERAVRELAKKFAMDWVLDNRP
jgi:hypothetical protein